MSTTNRRNCSITHEEGDFTEASWLDDYSSDTSSNYVYVDKINTLDNDAKSKEVVLAGLQSVIDMCTPSESGSDTTKLTIKNDDVIDWVEKEFIFLEDELNSCGEADYQENVIKRRSMLKGIRNLVTKKSQLDIDAKVIKTVNSRNEVTVMSFVHPEVVLMNQNRLRAGSRRPFARSMYSKYSQTQVNQSIEAVTQSQETQTAHSESESFNDLVDDGKLVSHYYRNNNCTDTSITTDTSSLKSRQSISTYSISNSTRTKSTVTEVDLNLKDEDNMCYLCFSSAKKNDLPLNTKVSTMSIDNLKVIHISLGGKSSDAQKAIAQLTNKEDCKKKIAKLALNAFNEVTENQKLKEPSNLEVIIKKGRKLDGKDNLQNVKSGSSCSSLETTPIEQNEEPKNTTSNVGSLVPSENVDKWVPNTGEAKKAKKHTHSSSTESSIFIMECEPGIAVFLDKSKADFNKKQIVKSSKKCKSSRDSLLPHKKCGKKHHKTKRKGSKNQDILSALKEWGMQSQEEISKNNNTTDAIDITKKCPLPNDENPGCIPSNKTPILSDNTVKTYYVETPQYLAINKTQFGDHKLPKIKKKKSSCKKAMREAMHSIQATLEQNRAAMEDKDMSLQITLENSGKKSESVNSAKDSIIDSVQKPTSFSIDTHKLNNIFKCAKEIDSKTDLLQSDDDSRKSLFLNVENPDGVNIEAESTEKMIKIQDYQKNEKVPAVQENQQKGDGKWFNLAQFFGYQCKECKNKPVEIRYATTKISKYERFSTFEVLKSTRCKPTYLPSTTESIFVMKNKI